MPRLRKCYTGEIIIGGAGLSTTGIATQINDFGNKLKSDNLVDYFVRGEGEYALVDILNEATGPGINNDNYVQIEDLNSLSFPDYDDALITNNYAIGRTTFRYNKQRLCA